MTIHSTDPTMSETPTIGYDRFPRQGAYKNSRVRVCFNYDADRSIDGTVVRDDAEMPGLRSFSTSPLLFFAPLALFFLC